MEDERDLEASKYIDDTAPEAVVIALAFELLFAGYISADLAYTHNSAAVGHEKVESFLLGSELMC